MHVILSKECIQNDLKHEFLKMLWVLANRIITRTHAYTCTVQQTHRQADTVTQTHRYTETQTYRRTTHTHTHTHL